jgi:hypothetical protein
MVVDDEHLLELTGPLFDGLYEFRARASAWAGAGVSDSAAIEPIAHASGSERTLSGLFRYFLKLGSWGFGGPIALAGYMRRDLVEGRHWYSDAEYQQGLAIAQTMPGPLAAQLAMWLGYLERGALGALVVTVPFVVPPFLIVTAVAMSTRSGASMGGRVLRRRPADGDHRHRRLQARARRTSAIRCCG